MGGLVGVVMCIGPDPVPGDASLAAFGAVFCALLAHVSAKQAPASCGCISWLKATRMTVGAPIWRAVARCGIGGRAVRRHLRPVRAWANGETL